MGMNRKRTVNLANRIAAAILCLFILAGACCCMHAMAEEEPKTVRVGFYPCPFNIKDENGHMSGYAYDYQQDLAAYTGWKYEYVEA